MFNNVDNSLLSKYDELRLRYSDLDMVALTEIKPKNGEIPDTGILESEGYDMYLSVLNGPYTRGFCIYVHKRLSSTSVTIPVNIQYKDAVWVKIYGENVGEAILVGCIYRSGTLATARLFDT